MSLVQITADLRGLTKEAARIADALEALLAIQVRGNDARAQFARRWPVPPREGGVERPEPPLRPRAGRDSVRAPTDEALWEMEQEQERSKLAGSPPPEETNGD